jgi:hypothetical protein
LERSSGKSARRNKALLFIIAIACLGLALVACAPRQSAEGPAGDSAGLDASTVELPAWSMGSDCKSCHVAEVESASGTACTYSLHTGVECTTCHTDDGGLLAKGHESYATAKQPTKLKRTDVASGTCTTPGCHNADEIKAITAGLTVLTDTNGTTINPHDLPQTEGHDSSVTCSSCHKMHKEGPIEESAQKTCLSCHHAGVYECGTCHE